MVVATESKTGGDGTAESTRWLGCNTYLDVKEVLSQDWRAIVDWSTLSVELTAKHFSTDGHAEHITSELTMGVGVVDVGGTLEDLCDERETN